MKQFAEPISIPATNPANRLTRRDDRGRSDAAEDSPRGTTLIKQREYAIECSSCERPTDLVEVGTLLAMRGGALARIANRQRWDDGS